MAILFRVFSAKAVETINEAKDVQEEAKRLKNKTQSGRRVIDKEEVQKRITELYEAENATVDLLKQAKKANETAHFAILNGTKTLAEAKRNLELLEVRRDALLF